MTIQLGDGIDLDSMKSAARLEIKSRCLANMIQSNRLSAVSGVDQSKIDPLFDIALKSDDIKLSGIEWERLIESAGVSKVDLVVRAKTVAKIKNANSPSSAENAASDASSVAPTLLATCGNRPELALNTAITDLLSVLSNFYYYASTETLSPRT